MRLSQWLARLLSSDTPVASGRVRRRAASTAPTLYVRRLEDRRVLSVDVVDGQSFTIAENSAAGTSVGTVQVDQSAPAQPLTFSIAAGNDAGAFLIDPNTGEISIADSAPLDFESTPEFQLQVTASLQSDSNVAGTSLVTVKLTDVFAPANVVMTASAASLTVVDGHIRVTQGATILFDAPQEDVQSLTITGSSAADTLSIDLDASHGNPIPVGGLTFDGDDPTTSPGDTLALYGGTFDKAVYSYTNGHDGKIEFTLGGTTSTINYTGLEPITNTGTATDIVLQLGTADDQAVLEDAGGGYLRLRSANGTFETTTFQAPTNSLSVLGGDGNDTITVAALSGSFALTVDGEAGTNSLIVDQTDAAVLATDLYRFAGFTFDQRDTPDVGSKLQVGFSDQGANVNAPPDQAVGAVFPENTVGFDGSLSVGRLVNPTITTGTLALNMPAGDIGATLRSGIELSWSGGRALVNEDGNDFVIYEAATHPDGPDAAMVQVHIVGVGWTKWRYEAPDSFAAYAGSTEGALATAFDLSDFGVVAGQAVDGIRYVNMMASDRMEGPGTEYTPGISVAEGVVIPEDGGATSNVFPDPGTMASFPKYGNSTFDPDPLYFGMLHSLGGAPILADSDTVRVTSSSVNITTDGTARPTIDYANINALSVLTRGGRDDVTVELSSALPAGGVTVDGGDPSDGDHLTLLGTTGTQSILLSGSSATVDGRTITMSGFEQLTVDVSVAGGGDVVTVDRTFTLPGNSASLEVLGDGGDQLVVDLTTGGSTAADEVAIDDASVVVTGGIAVDYSGLSRVELYAGAGADKILVAPSTTTTYLIDGGDPTIAVNPGDRATLNIAALAAPLMTITGLGTATLTSTSHASVEFVGIDSFGTDAPFDVTVDESANSNGAAADTFYVVRNGAADEISVNGALAFRADLAAINKLTVVGSAQDDELTLDFTAGDPTPAGGIEFQAGDQVTADTLHLIGSAIDTVAHQYVDSSTGSVSFGTTSIGYFAVEAMVDEIASKRKTFTFTGGSEDVVLDDDATPGDGWSQITSNNSPTTRFLAPSETAEVDAGAGADVVTLQGMDSQFAAEFTIRGGTGDDTINIVSNGAAGVGVEWISFPIFIDGGGDAQDSLVVDDTASQASKTYSISNMNIGGQTPPAGAAVDTPSPSPTVDGNADTGNTGEWSDIPVAFDSGARPAPSLQTILHYDFSEANNPTPGGTVYDSTSNHLDGTLPVTGGPNFREDLGKFGGALQFNGSTDFAWFQDSSFNIGSEGSLSVWVNLADTSRRNQIVEGPGNNGLEFQYRNSGALGQFYGSPNNSGDTAIAAGSTQASFQNTWTLVQFSWKQTSANAGELHVFINGAEVSYLSGFNSNIANWTTVIDTVDRFMTVGRDPVTGGRYFNGLMDDMAWFNTALTGTQLAQLYTQSVASAQGTLGGVYDATANGGNLIAYWNMDDPTGTIVAQGDGGTNIALHTEQPTARFLPTGGKIGGALEFNSPETFATFQDPTFDVGSQGTLSFWIYQRDPDRRNQIIEGPGDSGFEFQYRNSGSANGQFYGSPNRGVAGNTEDYAIESAKAKSTFTGAWHNMQYTWDFTSKTMHVFRDGVEVAYLTANDSNISGWNSVVDTVNGLFTVGRDAGAATPDRWLDGKLDDIAFFDTVLTQIQLDAVRTNSGGVGGAQADLGGVYRAVADGGNLIAYWNLDDPTGTTTVAGDGGTSITLNLNVPKQPEGAQFVDNGGPLLSNGTQLDSLDFDGDRDFIRTLDAAALDFDKTMGTISLWIKPSAHAADNSTTTGFSSLLEDSNRQISLGISWQTDAGAALGNADLYGRIVFSPWENVPGASTNVIVSGSKFTATPTGANDLAFDQWTQLTVTWDYTTHTANIYINGVADAPLINNTSNAAIWTQPAGNTGNFIFGGDGTASNRWYDGEMADVAIYGSALSASEVRTIVAKGAGDTGSFDLSGAKGRFTYDATNLYGLIQDYPPGGGGSNGPFSRLRIEIYLNDGTTPLAVLDTSLADNGIVGSVVVPNVDTSLYEFSIPLSALTGFDPNAGDHLTYRLTAYDADVPTGGFDTLDTTLGWIVEPPLASNGYRQLDFSQTENFFATGGRLTYSGVANLTVNGGSGNDVVTIVDSGTAVTNPTKTFTLDTGAGDDTVTIASLDSTFTAAVTIDGQGGTDVVTVDAALALGSAQSTGDLSIAAETVNLNQSIDTTGSTLAGSVGNVTLSVDGLLSIGASAEITATGNVLIDGGGDVEVGADITSQTGDVTIDNPTVLTADIRIAADAGDVTFGSTIDSRSGEFYELTIAAELGTVTFDDDAGSIDPFGRVRIDAGLVVADGVVKSDVAGGTGGAIEIHADEVRLNTGGGLDVGAGLATIVTLTDGVDLTLGADALGTLGLDGDEVQRITAGTFRFGDDRSSEIAVVNSSSFTGVDTLHLTTGAGISGSGIIEVPNLALTCVDDIGLTGVSDVDTLAAEVSGSGAGITFTDANLLLLDLVDGVAGIATDGGTTQLIVGHALGQTSDGAITSKYLRLAGTGVLYLLDEPTNDVDVLTAQLDFGDLYYVDADELAIGSTTSTEGITTGGGSLEIDAGDTLSVYRPIDAGAGAVLLTSLGAIEDTGPTGPKVIADSLDFGAVDGIGNVKPFETSVAHLSGVNLSTGTISIDDTSGGLLDVDYIGLTNLADGGITLTHVGALDITSEVLSMGGGIAFTSLGNGGGDDGLTIDARLRNLGGTGDITLTAADDLFVNDTSFNTDIRNSGTGSIVGTAGGLVTLGSDVIIRSATGAITNIPPELSNVVAPQISATGEAFVSFDYGRLNEFNFTALVDWSDGSADLLGLGAPGNAGTNHFYSGNPNLADPAAPIPITVTLRSDARIRFTGYETTSITVLADFPGDGVRNVRIDTTPKVPHLVAPPPTRITDIPHTVAPVVVRSQVTGGAGLVAGSEKTAERILILREVLPSGREGTEMQFSQEMLNRLENVYAKLRNGRYRLYLYEPEEQKLRKVLDVFIKDGKPAAADDARELRRDRPDGASLPADASTSEPIAAAAIESAADSEAAADPQADSSADSSDSSLAAGSLALGAGLVVASSQPWHERVDAALAKFRRYSPLRSRSKSRRTPR